MKDGRAPGDAATRRTERGKSVEVEGSAGRRLEMTEGIRDWPR